MFYKEDLTRAGGSVVEHPLREQEVVGLNPGRGIPKELKLVPVATRYHDLPKRTGTLLGAQHYRAGTGFSSSN